MATTLVACQLRGFGRGSAQVARGTLIIQRGEALQGVTGLASLARGAFADATVQVRRLDDDVLLGTGKTGADGNFQALLDPDPPPGTPLRVAATRDGRTVAALAFAGQTQPAGYVLAQGGSGPQATSVVLNPASTLALAAFLKRLQAVSARLTVPQTRAVAVNALPFLIEAYNRARRAAQETLVKVVEAGRPSAGARPDLGNLSETETRVLEKFLEQLLTAVQPEGDITLPPDVLAAVSSPDSPMRQAAEEVLSLLKDASEAAVAETTRSPEPVPAPSDWVEALPSDSPSGSPDPVASEAPTPVPRASTGGGSSGGGGARPAEPPTLTISLPGTYSLRRLIGNALGGNAAGSDATTAALRAVSGVAVAPDGIVFLADPVNHQVRRVVAGGPAERLTGSASATPGFLDNVIASAGLLSEPAGLAFDREKGLLLVCDAGNGRVRLVRPGGRIGTLAGGGTAVASDASALSVALEEPVAVAAGGSGTFYIADRRGNRVWRVEEDLRADLIATTGGPCALAVDPGRDLLWVGTETGQVLRVTGAGSAPALDAATPVFSETGSAVQGLAADGQGNLFVLAGAPSGDARLWRLSVDTLGVPETGRAPIAIAGSGVAGITGADYAAPLGPVPNALSVRLTVRHPASLAINLWEAPLPGLRAGQLYLGTSYGGSPAWGQVLKLEVGE